MIKKLSTFVLLAGIFTSSQSYALTGWGPGCQVNVEGDHCNGTGLVSFVAVGGGVIGTIIDGWFHMLDGVNTSDMAAASSALTEAMISGKEVSMSYRTSHVQVVLNDYAQGTLN